MLEYAAPTQHAESKSAIELFTVPKNAESKTESKSVAYVMLMIKKIVATPFRCNELDKSLMDMLLLTGLMQETDMRGTFLQLALNMAYDEKAIDLLTGLRAQTKSGKY